MRKAQTAVEFLVLMGFMVLVFAMFFVVIGQRAAERNRQAQHDELVSVAETIRQEAILAYRVRDGYERVFELPTQIGGQSYTVTLWPAPPAKPSEVLVRAGEFEYFLFLPVNLSTPSRIAPGYNRVTKNAGDNITISPIAKPPPQVCLPSDCDDGNTCTDDRCLGAMCGPPVFNNDRCDDGNLCTRNDRCGGGSCSGNPVRCPPGRACNPATGNCDPVLVCANPGQTNIRYSAGNTSGSEGIAWSGAGALSRDPWGNSTACCTAATHCVSSGSCVPLGVHASKQYACENTGLGAEFFLCTQAKDGSSFISSGGMAYCCSKFTADPDGPGPLVRGSYGFNASAQNKTEGLALSGACSDGSDNDCDGLADAYDYGCWSIPLNSTCGSNTAAENLTAYPNATMPGTVRYAYDWRVGGSSIGVLLMNFDVPDNGGANRVRDYAGANNAGTVSGALHLPSGGLGASGAYSFDGVDDRVSVPSTLGLGTAGVTMAAWVNVDSVSERGAAIKVGGNNGYGIGVGGTSFDTSGNNLVGIYEAVRWIPTGTPLGTGWHHIAMVIDGSGVPSLYKDGTLVGTYPGAAPLAPTGPISIGGYPSRSLDAVMDDVIILNRALSAEQIRELSQGRMNRTVAAELGAGQSWSVCVTPNNGTADGQTTCSAPVVVSGGASACLLPADAVTIRTWCGLNTTAEDLVAGVQGPGFSGKTLVYDWRVMGASMGIVNMNFDLDNSAGNGRTKDYTTYAHHGTERGGIVHLATAGRGGTGAYNFDWSNDYIDIPAEELADANDFTITFWFKADQAGQIMHMLWQGDAGGRGWGLSASEMHVSTGWYDGTAIRANRLSFFMGGKGANPIDLPSGPFSDTSGWHFVAVRVRDTMGGAALGELYLDNVLQSADVGSGFDRSAWLGSIFLGKPGGNSRYFDGRIDDVRIYDRWLSTQQLAELYDGRQDIIVQQETGHNANEQWRVCATSHDGTAEVASLCSSALPLRAQAAACANPH